MTSVIQTIRRSVECYKAHGGVETLCRVLYRLRIISVNHAFDIFIKELEASQNGKDAMKGGISFRELVRGEIETLTYAEGLSYTKDVPVIEDVRSHMDQGMRFFSAFDKKVVIALNGVHAEYANLVYLKKPFIRLPRGIVYLNAALTAPQYRHRGIGTALLNFLISVLQEEGYVRMISATFLENRGAAKWHEASGCKRWGRMRCLCFHGHDLWWTQLTEVGRRYPHLLKNEDHSFSPENREKDSVLENAGVMKC